MNTKRVLSTGIDMRGFLSFFILHELSKQKLCGDELALLIGSKKYSKLSPGTIYPALKRLKKLKLVNFRSEGRKKVYFLSDKGKKELSTTYGLFSNIFFGLKNKIQRKVKTKKSKK